MANIGAVLKDEVARISKREVRKAVDPVRKANAAHRHDIAAMKRELASMARLVRTLSRSLAGTAASATTERTEAPTQRITAKGIAAMRTRLALSAEKFGQLAGVSGQTIYKWENGTRPRTAQLATLAGLRGLSKRGAIERLEQIAAEAGKRQPRKQR